jgi:NSS family neurotransmitter:Na+ symporter
MSTQDRGHWGSRVGFILAAAGSAIGLGNIWKFPYIAGENGGGLFVLIYLACILFVGLPIMIAEILIGRTTQKSPVGAFKALDKGNSPWAGIGWLGVASAFVILSFYSVVAGWSLHYIYLSVTGSFSVYDPEITDALFGELFGNARLNLFWHLIFMVMCVSVVIAGVHKGVERWAEILMPMMIAMLLILFGSAITLEGFGTAVAFVFNPSAENLTAAGVLEALGHSFFTLSLGMGAMITYGSYLRTKDDVIKSSFMISGFDTAIALLACLVLFPITFTYGMEASAGPGLVFVNLPIAFAKMPGGSILATLFFALLTFAALTSAISLLEVAAAYFIDERGWSRPRAVLTTGFAIALVGIPSALSGAGGFFQTGMENLVGKSWFDLFDYLSSNWMLPLGGLGIALFMAWRVGGPAREAAFTAGTTWGRLYFTWIWLLRYLVPIAVLAVFLHAIGLI